jgi:predicted nucleic acid-binding protein
MLVVDASLAVELSLDQAGQEVGSRLGNGDGLVAPPLLWSEAPSALHEMAFRGDISTALAELALKRFLDGKLGIEEQRPDGLAAASWEIARNSVGPRPMTPSTSPWPRCLIVGSSRSTLDCEAALTDFASS